MLTQRRRTLRLSQKNLDQRLAARQDRDVQALTRSSRYVAGIFAYTIGKEARQSVRAGSSTVGISQESVDKLVQLMVDVAVAGYLAGVKRTRNIQAIAKDAVQLAANPFQKNVKKIAENFEIDLGDIRRRIESTTRSRVTRSVEDIRGRLNQALQKATAAGLPTKEAVKQVNRSLTQFGVTPTNPTYVETLVRTHAQIAYSGAQWIEYEEDEDLWGYTYVTVGDDRVREEHAALEGLTLKKDNPLWQRIWTPNGWNCRCQILPVYDTRRESQRQVGAPDEGFDFNPGQEFR